MPVGRLSSFCAHLKLPLLKVMAALGGLFQAAVIAGAFARHSSQSRLHFIRRSIYPSNHTFRKTLEGTSTVLQLHSHAALRRLHNTRYLEVVNAAMASETKESAQNNPGLCKITDEATKGYFLQQTMYRVKDPKISLDFYSRILGMKLLKRFDFPDAKFSLYFMGYEDIEDAPCNEVERTIWTFKCKATLELTHNWGTESDPEFKGYHNGNSEPRGYGHIGITVDDTYKACERFEKLGVEFAKRPDDGKMKGLAFIKDPDGYWIEIFDLKGMERITS